jgi:hypothetical protein
MASRKFIALGCGLSGLGLFALAFRVFEKVHTGHSLETYYSGSLIQWTYGGAFVLILLLVLSAFVGVIIRIIFSFRERRELLRIEKQLEQPRKETR